MTSALPAYTLASNKQKLIESGCSGTVYSFVMREGEEAFSHVVKADDFFSMYHEPWTQKQDTLHERYFETWLGWTGSIVVGAQEFKNHYPTAGASEGIFKIMSEYVADCAANGVKPIFHMFDGDYEGYAAFAESLNVTITRHRRDDWRLVPQRIKGHEQFWISQPSAINGEVWKHWDEFVLIMANQAPHAEIIPDLTYVGAIAETFKVDVSAPNIPCFVFSHSKPLGGYYHRVGGVFAKTVRQSLFGNKWFKNLLSLRWATEMMERHTVTELPKKYQAVQQLAASTIGSRLGISLKASGVFLLGTAPASEATTPLLMSLVRGTGSDAAIRLCVTPEMDEIVNGDT